MDSEDRQNNVQCAFDRDAKRPSAYEIHRWLNSELRVPQTELLGIQLDVFVKSVFLKLRTPELCHDLVNANSGTRKFQHLDGHISNVTLSHAGFGIRTVRVFNLPFEVRNETISRSLMPYGTVLQVVKEKWSSAYVYPVENGIRSVKMIVHKHIPSFLVMAGNRAFITYTGQPQTCSFCHVTGHIRKDCPRLQQPAQLPLGADPGAASYAAVALGPVPPSARRLAVAGSSVDDVPMDIATSDSDLVADTPASTSESAAPTVPLPGPADVANVVPPTEAQAASATVAPVAIEQVSGTEREGDRQEVIEQEPSVPAERAPAPASAPDDKPKPRREESRRQRSTSRSSVDDSKARAGQDRSPSPIKVKKNRRRAKSKSASQPATREGVDTGQDSNPDRSQQRSAPDSQPGPQQATAGSSRDEVVRRLADFLAKSATDTTMEFSVPQETTTAQTSSKRKLEESPGRGSRTKMQESCSETEPDVEMSHAAHLATEAVGERPGSSSGPPTAWADDPPDFE